MGKYGIGSSFNNIFTNLVKETKGVSRSHRNMLLFAYEGIIITLVNNLINNNNNLFATRLGASDFELSLVTAIPQFVSMIVLIPGGILTDRMTNKRRMTILSLCSLAAFYIALGFVPMMGKYRFLVFLILISLSIGPMTLYNASWQAYFSDVVSISERNRVFTLRTKWSFIISIITPLITGTLLASASTNDAKLKFHQGFFWTGCILILLQIFVLKKITGGNGESSQSSVTLKDLKNVAINLAHNKRFLGFLGVALLFYIGWQLDWTLYYIGEVNYLKLNEAWLGYVNVGGALIQFLTIGFWSRMNEKNGIRFSIIMGGLGLCFTPLVVILSTMLPLNIAQPLFLILNTAVNFAFATVSLNVLQCLLQVIPEKNKTLSISIYTLLISFSNAVMPMAGIKIYTSLGANLKALHITYLIIVVVRIMSTALWTLRWWLLRDEPM